MFKNQKSVQVATRTDSKKPFYDLHSVKKGNLFEFIPKAKKAQVKNVRVDARTKHAIFDRVISLLEGRRFDDLPFVLHEKTKAALRADGMAETEITTLENSAVEETPLQRHISTIPRELHSALIRRESIPGMPRSEAKRADFNLIFDARIVKIPDEDLNLSICEQLEKEFTREHLRACPGFIVEDGLFLMLDVGPHLVERGFMMPVLKNGLITSLQIFRHCNDASPFTLISRTGGLNK